MAIITQLEGERITHSQDVIGGNRQYISTENIRLSAHTKFKQSHEGLTYEDLVNDGPFKCTESVQRARDTLHYHKRERHLFTYGRTNPQQYFATPDDAEMAARFREKITHSHPTGVKYSLHSSPNGHYSSSNSRAPLATALEFSKIQDFYHALIMVKASPLAMHNIRLYLQLTDPQRYDIIPPQYEEENRARVIRQRKGDVRITYKIYPHGTVEIFIECSKAPFPIETDFDITKLFSFVGEIRNTLQGWLQDVNDHIIPPIEEWRLVHADISKDVRVPERLHLTVPNMELNVADRVLRMYVKNLGHGSVLRLEEMRMFDEAFGDAVNSLRKDASSSSTTAMVTHSVNPAVFVEKAEQERKIAMLMSRVADLEEMILESRKLPSHQIRLNKETASSEQIVVIDKKKEELDNSGKLDSSNHGDYKQAPFNNALSITTTNYVDVENNNNKTETSEVWQQQEQLEDEQEQQPIVIPPSATVPDEDVPIKISSAADLLEHRNNSKNHLRISTGSKRFDDLLSGGIERGAVTEVVGPSGTGKTELCSTLSVNAHQLKHQQEKVSGDEFETTASGGGGVLFIDTKKAYDRHRIHSIAQARGLDPETAVESLTVETIPDFQALEEFILQKVDEFLKKNRDTVLVIVASIMTLRPTQHKESKEEYLALWQQRLDSLMHSLQRAALQYNVAVVVTNDTDKSVLYDYPFGQTQIPRGENIILHAITHRLSFKNHDDFKVAKIVHSSCYPERDIPFTIKERGITDVQP